MKPLSPDLRASLERAVLAAREEAEKSAEVALKTLAVDKSEPFVTHTQELRRLRNALRARARQLGGGRLGAGFRSLIEEVAYEQWHRMLFTRFLLENDLLIHPTGVAVTLQDCVELAAAEGESDPWQLAARYASAMLPGIFLTDDPCVQVHLPPEGRAALEAIVVELARPIFTSDDGLGWVYQFWQSKKKKEVSSSGRKISGLDLAAYSQLFTEDYMVRFLLENSLGAWWAARRPDSPLVKEFTYLRFADKGAPAAGSFPGWPQRAAEVTVMDPCCGSGHFLVAAFEMLRRMRMEEEGFTEPEAADAVLRDNLFGLEIDPRCVQIAAFALALVAWKVGGYRPLPLPNIACSGISVNGRLQEWTKLAGDDVNLKHTLESLYHLFRNAPDLGSLINPAHVPLRDRMFASDLTKVGPLLEQALTRERTAEDPVAAVMGEAARGIACAAELLARQYTLVATNVPYLQRGKQTESLKEFCASRHPDSVTNLATVFVERCRSFTTDGGSWALVTPQNWLLQKAYHDLRRKLLVEQAWDHVSKLGPGAFETISGEVVNVVLMIVSNLPPGDHHVFSAIDAATVPRPSEKSRLLQLGPILVLSQSQQLQNADCIVTLADLSTVRPMSVYCTSAQGIKTGDDARFRRFFWEVSRLEGRWRVYQSTADVTQTYGGLLYVLDWGNQGRNLARLQGIAAWGRPGIAVSLMSGLRCTLYTGQPFDSNMSALVPRDPRHLPALWAYCQTDEFVRAVRRIDSAVKPTDGSLIRVPFDLERWQQIAEAVGPLPEPGSNDPTQWLFQGDLSESTEPLQVAVARLLAYRWPQQEPDRLSPLADEDGIVPLPAVAREEPAAERLRGVLAAAYGESWSPGLQERLLNDVGFAGKGLDVWLRDGFFEQHSKLFQQRPFIWHIWDGRRDGFSALANYHKLDSARLDKLIYTYLGEWIRVQRAARDAGTPGAEGRLVAALELHKKLEAIRDGEPPYDIYVRWKPVEKQPIGWNPDLDDGVRMNIRPFVTAGVLRSRLNVRWNKDRGLNPDGSERINDRHLTVAEKMAAREAAKL